MAVARASGIQRLWIVKVRSRYKATQAAAVAKVAASVAMQYQLHEKEKYITKHTCWTHLVLKSQQEKTTEKI